MRAAAPGDGDESADALAGTGQSAGTPAPLPGDWAALHGVTMAVGGLNTVLAVAAWYASNIGVLLLNKMLLSYHGFKFPVTLTAIHMIACSVMSYIAIDLFKVVPPAKARSRQQLSKIVVLGSFFCLAVVLGNVSLKFIPVSFNQAIGATTPFFTAVMAFVLQRRREGWVTYLTLVPVVLGVMIATQAEPSFNMIGFVAAVMATAARALKSVLQGALLSNDSEKIDSQNLLRYMAPTAACLLVPVALIVEGKQFMELVTNDMSVGLGLLLLLNASVAYEPDAPQQFVNLTNFLVTKFTSPLTLQVLGNAKGAVAVVVSVAVFGNPVTVAGIVGYGITILGVVAYSEQRRKSALPASAIQSSPQSGKLSSVV